MRVLLASPLNPHTGYGNDGIGLAKALMQAGADVYLDPSWVQAPLPEEVALLLTKRLNPPFDLLINHTDPPQLGITTEARRNSTFTVGWTMWEMSTLDNCKGRSTLRKRLKNFDLVVGYDSVSTAALQPYAGSKVATVQGGFWPEAWKYKPRDFTGTLNFCMVGALGPRKDPMLAITAYQELRQEHPDLDIALNVKTVAPGLHSAMQSWAPGLRIYYDVWPQSVLRDFYYNQHVMLAPSRGEGKNMPALEFLSTGGTVIATNWGGHTQWLSSAIGYPLDYTLGPIGSDTPNCLWAKADKNHLKALMLHAAQSRAELGRKAQTAGQLIPAMCSWPKVVERLLARIAQTGEKGERLVHAARVAAQQNNTETGLL